MIRPRKWFWSKKKLFTGEQCFQACNIFEDEIAMSATYSKSKVWTWRHEILNEKFTWIHKWLHRCCWRMFETYCIGDKSCQHQESGTNIKYPSSAMLIQHHILVYCDVGDWLSMSPTCRKYHQHLKFSTNITMSPTIFETENSR